MTIRALIFDVDGTLADTEEIHRQAFNAAFAAEGLPWIWRRRTYRDLLTIAGGRERIAHFINTTEASLSEKARLHTRVDAIHAVKTRFYARFVADGRVVLRDGVATLIREARAARIKLALATTTSRANVDALLAHALGPRAARWFVAIGTGELNVPKKPAPDVYFSVIKELGLQPREVIAFEDSAIGLAAAKAARLFTVVTPTVWTAGDDFAAADVLLKSLTRGGRLGALCAAHLEWLNASRRAA